ncbi:MAG: hypothetical protein IKL55_04660 [Clostridia bacterium]|nr:hypothetical protein [Clostridia bacterium]
MADKYDPKYLKKDSEKGKSTSKVKSQQDIEKIEAAKAVLEKYKPMLEEISQASIDILAGSVMRPIHKKLEQMQAITEAKKEMDESIKTTTRREKQKIEEFETTIDVGSEDLDNVVLARNLVTLGRTNLAKALAIFAKTPHTLAATFYALKGDEEKRDISLKRAQVTVKDILTGLEERNESVTEETRKRVSTFNKVEKETDHHTTRELKAGAIDSMTQEFLERNSRGAIRNGLSLSLANIGNRRRFAGNMTAQLVENVGNFVGRKAALLGFHEVAEWVADKTVSSSDAIMRNVGMGNKALYYQLDKRTAGYDNAEKVSADTKRNVDGLQANSEKKDEEWEEKQTSSGIITKVGTKVTKLENKVTTASAKVISKGDMAVSEAYAKTASVLGFDQHGKQVIENAHARNIRRMNNAENLNKSRRTVADRVFGFKDKRKQEIINVGKEVSDFIDNVSTEIETQRTQYKVKRKFKAAERKVNALEAIRNGAQGVIDFISPSLLKADMERVAAQTELTMNPEKSNGQTEKNDDESRE